MDDLVNDFIAETREGLEALDSELVRFEQRPDNPETLGGIFRLIHTIKGTCGFLGLSRLQAIAHVAENVLGAFRDGDIAVSPTAVTSVLDAVDLIRTLTDALAETGAEPQGDDSALVARLEAVLAQKDQAGPGSQAAVPEGSRPDAKPPAATDGRSLIDQLGGDSTLDSAGEMAALRLNEAGAAAFAGIDPLQLQAALRDGLCAVARKPASAGAFQRGLSELAGTPLDDTAAAAAFEAMAGALAVLDVAPAPIDALRGLVFATGAETTPPAAAGTPARQEVANGPRPDAGPHPSPAPVEKAAPVAEGASATQTIRVGVDALEHLMTVVSELVLIRNQLIQALRLEPESPFAAPLNRLNQVTSELQESVMTTRMQPISGAWAKLPRLVRDLAQDLGKQIDLQMFGQDTELDRQVLELIKDPLTHMIRNAADHGLETPEERRAVGKPAAGRITLQARHEGGAIVIEVADDGRGLPVDKIRAKALASDLLTPSQAEQMSDADVRQLIFMPGFSTAAHVTSVSGRGVGMDVVRTNIERIGGAIEVTSNEGGGTRFIIRIPLTLTIVSALIVECCGERFAIPQSSVVELVSASGASGRAIEYVDGAAVLRLRDRLLPLISLQSLLQLEPADEPSGETCIAVARVGAFTFGVIVDRVFDTEEIVVKPVATVLRHLKLYSGATILGDGSVILILDPKGMSAEAGAAQGASANQDMADALGSKADQSEALLVFRVGDDALKAARLASVSRIEEVAAAQIEQVDGRTVIQYRGKLTPILEADGGPARSWEGDSHRPMLVFARGDDAVGLLVGEIVDIVDTVVTSEIGSRSASTLGSLIVAGRATELIDIEFYWRRAGGETSAAVAATPTPLAPLAPTPAPAAKRLLVVDASPFSQMLLRPLLSQAGYEVTVAADAAAALALYAAGEQFQLIMADTQSGTPEVKAFATTLARASGWHETPLLSLSLSSAGSVGAGLDRSTLLGAVSEALEEQRGAA